MSDAICLYKAILAQVLILFPNMLDVNQQTLAMLLTGLLRGKNGQLKEIVRYVRYYGKKQSLFDRFRRFMSNKNIVVETTYAPIVAMILAALSTGPLILAIDSTKIGGQCIGLMISIHYKSRALPLAWVIFKGKKGHCPQHLQLELLQRVYALLPQGREVVLLGDGEFDGSEVITWLEMTTTWHYVCRSNETTLVFYQGQWIALKDLPIKDKAETLLTNLKFTQSQQVGPVNILVVWHEGYQKHWFFVTNYADFETAKKIYAFRFTIETLFSDFKGRGFHLDKIRLWIPERVQRLLMMVAIGYVFLVFLGVESIITGVFTQLVRSDMFQESLFQLGIIYFEHLLNECLDFPKLTSLPPPADFEHVVIS
jgi:hypothetical protein